MRQQNARGEVARPFDSWKKYFHVSTFPPFIIVMFLHFPLFSFPRFSISTFPPFLMSNLPHLPPFPLFSFACFSIFHLFSISTFPFFTYPFSHCHVSPFPLFIVPISTFLDSPFPHFPVSPFSSLLDRPRSRPSIAPRRSTSCPSGTS